MTKFFKLPTSSLTGRMSHNKPAIQMLPMPTDTSYQRELDKIRRHGKAYVVARQQTLRVGDLVEWAPAGERGLWRVTDLSRQSDAADMNLSQIEQAVYDKKYGTNVNYGINPCEEIDLRNSFGWRDVPRGKVRLEWFSGWRGYEGKAHPVCVKIKDVRILTEMETLGLAAS